MKIKQIIRIIIFIISLILVGIGYYMAIDTFISIRHEDTWFSNFFLDYVSSIIGMCLFIPFIFGGETLYSLFVFKFGEKSVKFAVAFFIIQLIGGLILLLKNLSFFNDSLYAKYPHLFNEPSTLLQYVDVALGAVLAVSSIVFFIIIGIKLILYRK